MTWVKGFTTWGALEHDLTSLIVGDKADDFGVTVSTGDRWIREVTRTVTDGVLNSTTTVTSATANFVGSDVGSLVIGTGIPVGATITSVTNATTVVLSAAATTTSSAVTLQIATNTIRTPAAKDVASGNMGNRTGYWANLGLSTSNTGIPATAGPAQSTVCKMVSPFSSDPSTSGFHRWLTLFRINIANSVAGNYSTAQITYFTWDADSGAFINNGLLANLNAAGNVTLSNGLVVNLTDPSGFLTVNTYFARAFTSTYMYGIDLWPMLYRASGAHTFAVAPPGVAGTDYDVVKIAYPPQTFSGFFQDRSNMFHGLGIKTATGLGSSPLYTVSFPMALMKGRIFASATAGVLSLDVGQSQKDAVNSVASLRNCGGVRITNWLKVFTTPGSVTASAIVQYWISVRPDGIVVVLNGDPGPSGKLGTAWYGTFAPVDATYDVFPVSFNIDIQDYTFDQSGNDFALATQYQYYSLRRRQDGSEGGRDWQTRWMRADGLLISGHSGMINSDANLNSYAQTPNSSQIMRLAVPGAVSGSSTSWDGLPARQNKPSIDGKWWLYGFQYAEGRWDTSISAGSVEENRFIRGSHTTRYLFVPDTGWGSGDELTDSITGTRYLLITGDYLGVGSRIRTTSSTFYGGLAIAEL